MMAMGVVLLAVAPFAAGSHVDARDYPSAGAGEAAFAVMERALVRGFDYICGDTFCEGDYGNVRALQLRCSVRSNSGALAGCLWSFAGSYAYVSPADALPSVQARTWACHLPVVPGTPLAALLERLRGPDALDAPLPGTNVSSYEALTDCL